MAHPGTEASEARWRLGQGSASELDIDLDSKLQARR
jgi:hypothetical protein